MKKLSFDKAIPFALFLPLLFFLIPLAKNKLPVPADAILGLYHPWRDLSVDGFDPGKFPVKNPIATDPILQTYPWKKIVIDNMKDENLPLWNPYNFSGYPLLANVQSSSFAILNILFFIFPFNLAWSLAIILPAILASMFMYFFLRSLKISQTASVFGSVVLPFSGFFVSWQQWGTVITSAMWLPLILLAINKIFQKVNALWFLILVFAVSQTIFSGHLQTAFYALLATLLYLGYRHFNSKNFRAMFICFFAITLGIIVSAIQLMPTLEFLSHSARSIDQGYYQGREDWFLPLKHLIQLVAPDYFGNPTTYNYRGIWNYGEFVSFIGIIPLGLALLAILQRSKATLFFLVLTIGSLALATLNPISKLPYVLNLPLISSAQPSRIIFLMVFSLSTLAALGFDYFFSIKKKVTVFLPGIALFSTLVIIVIFTFLASYDPQVALRNLVFPLALVIIFFAITLVRSLISKRLIVILLIIVGSLELFRFGYKYLPFTKSSLIFPQTKTTEFLENQPKPFRIMTTDRRILPPNTSSVYQIESVEGYDPLYLSDYAKLVSAWESGNVGEVGSFGRIITPHRYDSPIANFLNVRYLLTFDDINSDQFTKVLDEGETKVFENNNVLPRAFFAQEVVKVGSKEEELKTIIDKNIDLNTKAASQEFEFPNQEINSSIKIINYQDQNFELATTSDKDAPLIVSNVFYPDWRAFVDGNEVQIRRVNFMFQSIMVPHGTHKIEFKFKPKSFYNGLYISSASFISTLIIALYLWRRKYQS